MTDTQIPPPPEGSIPGWPGPKIQGPLRKPTAIEPSWVAAALLVGLGADLAIRRSPWNNIASSLLVVSVGVGLALAGQLKTRTSRVLVGIGVTSGLFMSIRSDHRLTVANLLVVLSLYLAAILHSQGRSLWELRPLMFGGGLLRWLEASLMNLAEVPHEVRARKLGSQSRWQGTVQVLRGVLLATPVLIVLGVLLASADQVFASFFGFDLVGIDAVLSHSMLFFIGVAGFAGLLRYAILRATEPAPQVTVGIGRVEATVILVGMNILFAAFAFAQVWARSDAGEAVLANSQLQYKDYARQGFFQLLWVAAITLVILMGIHVATKAAREPRIHLRGLSLAAVALTLLIVGVACFRLGLYIGDNGLTPLRFYSLTFAGWIGLAFCIVAVRLSGWYEDRSWLTTALGASGVVAVMALNVANPEAVIAANNLSRPTSSAIVFHVDGLSGDGLAALATDISEFEPEVRQKLVTRLCQISADRIDSRRDFGWLDYNRGEAKADQALTNLCA